MDCRGRGRRHDHRQNARYALFDSVIFFSRVLAYGPNSLKAVKWIPGPTNDADLHTKIPAGTDFEKHVTVYMGKDEYSSMS